MEWLRLIGLTLRRLQREPAFTGGALALLALGIGLTTAAFGVIDQLLWRPLPGVPASARLVSIYNREGGRRLDVASYVDLGDLAERGRAFTAVAAYKPLHLELAASGEGDLVRGLLVSRDYFRTLGLSPFRGRFFLAAETARPGAAVAVLSYDLWRTRFGGSEDVLGRTVGLDGLACAVIGVAPPGFRGTSEDLQGALFVPMALQPRFMGEDLLDNRGWGGVMGVARLAPGVSLPRAQADAERVARALAREYPATNAERHLALEPLAGSPVSPFARDQWRGGALLLSITVLLVMLVACANVATLLSARAIARREELGVRRALGASPERLAGELLLETGLLASAGGLLGWGVASGCVALARRAPLEALQGVALDARALAMGVAMTLASCALASLAPMLEARRQLVAPLRAAGVLRPARGRALWVGLQVAVSLVLLVGTALLGRTFAELRRVPLGFDPARVLVAELGVPAGLDEGVRRERWRRVEEAVGGLPGVRSPALTSRLPGGGDNDQLDIAVLGRAGRSLATAAVQGIGGDYFRALGVRPREGRDLALDDERRAAPAAVVNESFARRFWPGETAVGKVVELMGGRAVSIVGVVPDIKDGALRRGAAPLFYLPWSLMPNTPRELYLVARAEGDPSRLPEALRRTAIAAGAGRARATEMLEDRLGRTMAPERTAAALLGVLSALALLLTLVGLASLLAWSVAQRSRELGLRAALGADAGRLRRLVLGQGLRVAGGGIAGGTIAALAAARAARGLLFGVGPYDPLALLAPAAFLLVVAAAAAWWPAQRATRADPMAALRQG